MLMQDNHNRVCNGIWFVHDICGIICAIFTWALILFAQYIFLTCVLWPQPDTWLRSFHFVIFEFFLVLAFVSHLKTMFTDPGSVPRGTATREAMENLGIIEGTVIFKCSKCCSIKPQRAHHCSVCQRCIRKMDHHCPWVNNCVGLNNQKYFVLFTLYIAILSTHALFVTSFHLVQCVKDDWNNCEAQPLFGRPVVFDAAIYRSYGPQVSPWTIVLIVGLLFESLLFAIFTMIMFFVQVQGIYNDETGIESLKKEKAHRSGFRRRNIFQSFKLVCGQFSVGWLNPFTKPMFNNNSDYECHLHDV